MVSTLCRRFLKSGQIKIRLSRANEQFTKKVVGELSGRPFLSLTFHKTILPYYHPFIQSLKFHSSILLASTSPHILHGHPVFHSSP